MLALMKGASKHARPYAYDWLEECWTTHNAGALIMQMLYGTTRLTHTDGALS
jgi:hypothetical protein